MIIGSGVDVIEIARMERALRRRGQRFEERVFTLEEIRACRGRPAAVMQFAVRFAAKEAAMKAVGTGWARGVTWHDIESVAQERGAPFGPWLLNLHGRAGEIARELGVNRAHLATGHSRTHAMAMVLLETPDP